MTDIHKDPDQLERQVDDARARLSQTVDALGEQLSPGQLLDQVFHLTKEQGGEFADNLGRQVKDNPLALLLTGVGVTWLVAGSASHKPNTHLPTHSSASSAGSSSDDDTVATRVQASINSGAEAIKDKTANVSNQLERTLREHPLVMSGLGIALGAALGALIPPTAVEDKLLGEKSDQAMSKATEVLTNKYEEEHDRLKQKVQDTEQVLKQ